MTDQQNVVNVDTLIPPSINTLIIDDEILQFISSEYNDQGHKVLHVRRNAGGHWLDAAIELIPADKGDV